MASAIKKCRVCGKEYEACHTNRSSTSFRWQEVACSPQCGSTYFAQIEESRKVQAAKATIAKKKKPVKPNDTSNGESVKNDIGVEITDSGSIDDESRECLDNIK